MAITFEQVVQHLSRMHLFRTLEMEQVAVIAARLEKGRWDANKVVIEQGQEPKHFYIIYRGQVEVLVASDPEDGDYHEQHLAYLENFDYFGEQSIINEQVANATVRTTEPVILLYISRHEFLNLLKTYPAVLDALILANATRSRLRDDRYRSWLTEDETVFLLAKHPPVLLFTRIWMPVGVVFLLLLVVFALWYFLIPYWGYSLLTLLIPAAWAVFYVIDWSDDNYIITNKRVISDERLALLHAIRAEAPLWTVRTVQISQPPLGRTFGYGSLTIQTITGSVTFNDIPDPFAVSEMLQERIERTRAEKRREDEETLRRDIRRSIGWEDPGAWRPSSDPITKLHSSRLPKLIRFRKVEGDMIIWHKHPVVLLRQTMIPNLIFVIIGVLMAMWLLKWPPIMADIWAMIPLLFGLVGGLFAVLGNMMFWMYKYRDWANDTYMVTSDQIIDSERKPWLGDVDQRTAMIDNVLNVRFERPGLLAAMFNYGNVTIQTGGDTGELTFNGVYNPLEIQQEIFRRMEINQRSKVEAAAKRRRDEIVQWLRAYAQVTQPPRPERPWTDFPDEI